MQATKNVKWSELRHIMPSVQLARDTIERVGIEKILFRDGRMIAIWRQIDNSPDFDWKPISQCAHFYMPLGKETDYAFE